MVVAVGVLTSQHTQFTLCSVGAEVSMEVWSVSA